MKSATANDELVPRLVRVPYERSAKDEVRETLEARTFEREYDLSMTLLLLRKEV